MSHHTEEDEPAGGRQSSRSRQSSRQTIMLQVAEPAPDPMSWSRVAEELLATSGGGGGAQPNEVDDMPLGASAMTPGVPARLPASVPCTPRFFHDRCEGNVGGPGACPESGGDAPRAAIADILCEEAIAWEAKVQDANARLEAMKERSERRIAELEFQISQLTLENTHLKKRFCFGLPEFPRASSRRSFGGHSARIPSTLGLSPTPMRPSSKSARKTVEALAGTSSLTGMWQQFSSSALCGPRVHDAATLATAISPRRAHTKSPPRRQSFGFFTPEAGPLCPPRLDGRWHTTAGGGVTPARVR